MTNNSSDGLTADPATAWTKVFDLGTRLHPGEAAATADTTDPNKANANNSLSAVDLFGANAYVGFCGACDIVTGTRPFHSGLATNVGGSKAPKPLTADGWHIAKAIGLPQRYIQGVTVDHADPKTVYAAIRGYGRRWIPPGALNDDTSKVGTGHLFVSHDAGEHFTDISGNLPDLPANAVLVRGTTLIVATDNGVYTTDKGSPGAYAVLAQGLPTAPVLSLQSSPRNTAEIVAASYGRGVYTVVLPGWAAPRRRPARPHRGLLHPAAARCQPPACQKPWAPWRSCCSELRSFCGDVPPDEPAPSRGHGQRHRTHDSPCAPGRTAPESGRSGWNPT